MRKYQSLLNSLEKYDSFLLTTHVNPDGDAVGSLLGLKYILQSYADEIDLVVEDSVPEYLSFLSGTEDIYLSDELANTERKTDYDLVFVVDCGDLERIGKVADLIPEGNKIINIDHHDDNQEYGSYNYVDSTVSSAGELVYDLAVELGANFKKDFGMAIAAAIITDTGNFKFSNTTPKAHRIIADMLELGIDTKRIIKEVYQRESYGGLKLKGKVLSDLKLAGDRNIAWASVSQQDLDLFEVDWEDTEGLVNSIRGVKGVEVGVLFKEVAEEKIRVSFRSNEYFAVNEFAHQFEGGGHPRAAGCTVMAPLAEAEERVISKLESELGVKNQ
ncbi:DHH family phosphoesterase [Acetohalobium arabaticum]|uniref:Phosphoesterase RecJ domain protein n=1 Tax=Acetohalobium arabaticum (strain ATCC 49924 / DSM 5501 / Z-7288) TaxID=574087 RepID=D9QRF9_ACEAZ|nr:bifunctional oligoribonuclease/PAP phosphatase NrnA [Acetohalobium arabaticum]ADL13100.1 phosphoesterase RecJ domain protein [Acetohalobium arabaticum DSM 5501]